MTKISGLLLFLLALSGCKSYVYVMETNSTNSKNENNAWVYENDTLKITYDFWYPHGLMKFTIFNKLDKPVYIDWKKSSYISNDVKFNYWSEIEISETEAYSLGYVYSAKKYSSSYSVGASGTVGTTVKEKPERVTFIPPKSTFTKSLYVIQPKQFDDISGSGHEHIVPRNDKPSKTVKIYTLTGAADNKNPVRFRNFLTYDLAEDFSKESYVDNGFYIATITQIPYKHFEGKYLGLDKQGDYMYEFPYYKPSSYYYKLASQGVYVAGK